MTLGDSAREILGVVEATADRDCVATMVKLFTVGEK